MSDSVPRAGLDKHECLLEYEPMTNFIFDPDALLAALPRRKIQPLLPETPLPRRRAVADLSDYNGFTGKERLRTFEVAKWLMRLGAMEKPSQCDLCGKDTDQQHAEDYYDLRTWMDVCRSCHGKIHQRFRYPHKWQPFLDSLSVSSIHWVRLVSREPFDLAALLRARGVDEPSYETFACTTGSP